MEEGYSANLFVYFASCALNLSTAAFILGTKAVKSSLFLCLPTQISLNPQYYHKPTKFTPLLPFKGIFCVLEVHGGSLSRRRGDIRPQARTVKKRKEPTA